VLAAAVAGMAALVAVLLAAGGDPPPPAADPVPVLPPPPSPVSAQAAERELELRFGTTDDEAAAVRCPRRVEPSRTVRCELRYKDGIARALLVRISPLGELEADIPYPATIRR
jgi:hypothetical protein